MLECLLAAGGRVVSAEELLERVWDEAADPFTTAVKTTIRRLRAKLGDPPVIAHRPRGRLPDRRAVQRPGCGSRCSPRGRSSSPALLSSPLAFLAAGSATQVSSAGTADRRTRRRLRAVADVVARGLAVLVAVLSVGSAGCWPAGCCARCG